MMILSVQGSWVKFTHLSTAVISGVVGYAARLSLTQKTKNPYNRTSTLLRAGTLQSALPETNLLITMILITMIPKTYTIVTPDYRTAQKSGAVLLFFPVEG